ncbi:gonadotropin-releasing hormone II receptor-like isoform X3 [Gambusia affinis]|nr:gonadotropin-releasing hormone II receptor-like isoform X3 [Gambusia affinis]
MNSIPCESAVTMRDPVADPQVNVTSNCSLAASNLTAAEDVPQLPTFTTAAKIRVIITFILCGVSAFCNLAVLWAAHRDGKRKSHVRVLIVNLTVADLLVTFVVMPVDAAWNITVQWLAGDFACRLLMFLKLLAMYSCAFVTVVISLDRQAAILNPLAINKARMRNRIMLAAAWGMSVVLSIPQIFLFHNVTIVHPERFTQCTTWGSFATRWHETAYNMFTFSCLFLLPLVIMITCYARIFHEISKRLKKDNLSCLPSAHQRSTSEVLQKQHPQGADENVKNERCDRLVFHRLLDSVLPAGTLVLVLSRPPGGQGVPLADPHPVHLRAGKRLPGPANLRPVHHPLQEGAPEVLPQRRLRRRRGKHHRLDRIVHVSGPLAVPQERVEAPQSGKAGALQRQPQESRASLAKQQQLSGRGQRCPSVQS